MCGIAGFWSPKVHDGAKSVLERMLAQLHHRGPDGSGMHFDADRGLAMGHTRLSIIDLNTGHQPLVANTEKPVVLTVNGEFYDYKPIRTNLVCRGVRFGTKSDSEVALHQYLRTGLACVDGLRGEFAFALYDGRRERMVLVRDRFGIKPLYYSIAGSTLIYGSEIKSILAHDLITPVLNDKAVLHQMMQTMVPGMTAFEGISALLPGHMLIVDRESDGRLVTSLRRYWDLEFPPAEEHESGRHPDDYYVEGVRDRLIDAVRVRLEADVPVGCYLSGGIDSCCILGMATAMQQSPVKAYTISFDHDDYDESAIAREMAADTRAEQELLELKSADLYGESFVKTVWHAERTFYNTLAVAKWHMSRRVRDSGFKVVITGEGADELFAGYPAFQRDMALQHGGAERFTDEAKRVAEGAILAPTQVRHPAFDELCGFTPAWIQPWMLTLEQVRPLLAAPLREELRDYDPIQAIAGALDPGQLRGRHPLDQGQYTWSKTMLEGQILSWGGDRVDMAHSMESRPAFLDHHLAEFATRIPPELRIRDGVEKWVLREAMRGVLPETLYKRPKFAFMAPPSHFERKEDAASGGLVERWLTRDMIEELGLFDPDQVAGFLASRSETLDPAKAVRNDVILNHLLGLHLVKHMFVASSEKP